MKIPVTPPRLQDLLEQTPGKRLLQILDKRLGPESKGRYLHWDKLRHLKPPNGFSSEEWWLGTALARANLSKSLPFDDKHGKSLHYVPTEGLHRRLHLIDQKAGGAIVASESDLLNADTRDRYLINSLFEEAITSSQLEGAATTRKVAREMLRSSRKPANKSELMIVNNYHAMLFIREARDRHLSPELIGELHEIVCEGTLDDASALGRWRTDADDIQIYDHRDGTTLHIPPDAITLDDRIQKLCSFANAPADDANSFLHPVIRAILLHFILGYDHPFVDGNGRAARALFYWYMAKQGYWLTEFISISSILRQQPAQYARAYLHVETDSGDVTYFLIHQCDVILRAIDELNEYVTRKADEQRNVDRLLKQTGRDLLNHRQSALAAHAIRHPDANYTIQSHRTSHGVTYQTARTDLQALASMGLLIQRKRGKKFEYSVPEDFTSRLRAVTD